LLPPLSKLAPEIKKEQDQSLGELRLSAFDLLGRAEKTGLFYNRRWYLGVGCFLVGVVVVTALVAVFGKPFARLTYQVRSQGSALGAASSVQRDGKVGQWVAAREGQALAIFFSDGSMLGLKPGGRLRVTELGRTGAELALEHGIVQVQVEGTRLTEYHLWVGPFELTLPKGSAQATWDPMTLQLELVVQEGYVVIAGCQFGQGRSVTAGKELGTRCSEP